MKFKKILIFFLLISILGCSKEDTTKSQNDFYVYSEDVWTVANDEATPYYVMEHMLRLYFCADVADDFWRYPSYQDSFNHAFIYCNSTLPSYFNKTDINYNESLYLDGSVFISSNYSISNNQLLMESNNTFDVYAENWNGKIILFKRYQKGIKKPLIGVSYKELKEHLEASEGIKINQEYCDVLEKVRNIVESDEITVSSEEIDTLKLIPWQINALIWRPCAFPSGNDQQCGDSPCNEFEGLMYCKKHFKEVQK